MLAHFIQHKGKGSWVIALPCIIGAILFIIANAADMNDKYVGPAAILLSGFILWFADGGPALLSGEKRKQHPKPKNQLMWIEVKYWALMLLLAGCIFLAEVWK